MFALFYILSIVVGLLIADHCPDRWNQFTTPSAWRPLGKGRFIFTWKE